MKKKMIRIDVQLDIEISKKKYDELSADESIDDFIVNNCFRNNNRRLVSSEFEVIEKDDERFYPIGMFRNENDFE